MEEDSSFLDVEVPNVQPVCACGGVVEYSGASLCGMLKCAACGDFLIGVGFDFIESINQRWARGDRGSGHRTSD